jgi:hypothetical protein
MSEKTFVYLYGWRKVLRLCPLWQTLIDLGLRLSFSNRVLAERVCVRLSFEMKADAPLRKVVVLRNSPPFAIVSLHRNANRD